MYSIKLATTLLQILSRDDACELHNYANWEPCTNVANWFNNLKVIDGVLFLF